MKTGFNKNSAREVDLTPRELKYESLPAVLDSTSLAFTLGIRHRTLWWLIVANTYAKQLQDKGLYTKVSIPKRSGRGRRVLHTPCAALKNVQSVLLEVFLNDLPAPDYLGAYVPGRSIMHTVNQHVGKKFLISVDITDFFPSITRHAVEAWFKDLGYDAEVANLFGGLTTVPVERRVKKRGRAPYKYVLPQGAPTSPALANHVIRESFDEVFVKWLRGRYPSGTYTRYSDNIEISFERELAHADVEAVLTKLDGVLRANNLRRHPRKTKVRGPRNQRPMRVLGVSVQEHANVPKRKYRYLRGLVHKVWCDGVPTLLERDDIDARDLDHAVQIVRGMLQYWGAVNPEKMRGVIEKWEDIELVYRYQHNEKEAS